MKIKKDHFRQRLSMLDSSVVKTMQLLLKLRVINISWTQKTYIPAFTDRMVGKV